MGPCHFSNQQTRPSQTSSWISSFFNFVCRSSLFARVLEKLLQKMSIDWCSSAVSACITFWLAWQPHSPMSKDIHLIFSVKGCFFCSCDVSHIGFVPRLRKEREIAWIVIKMLAHCASKSRHYLVFGWFGLFPHVLHQYTQRSRWENMYLF